MYQMIKHFRHYYSEVPVLPIIALPHGTVRTFWFLLIHVAASRVRGRAEKKMLKGEMLELHNCRNSQILHITHTSSLAYLPWTKKIINYLNSFIYHIQNEIIQFHRWTLSRKS